MEDVDRSGFLEHAVPRHPGDPDGLVQADAAPLRSARDAARLFPHAIRRYYSKGEWIGGGHRSEAALYVVLEGCVGLLMQDSEGRQALLGTSGRGGVIAADEMGCRSHAVRLLAQSRALVMHVCARDLASALGSSPRAAALVVSALTARLVETNAKLASLAFHDVRTRVADTLLECACVRDGAWVVECGSEEIARRVAASREMVTRVVGRMIDEGLVRRHKRKTVILDRDALAGAGGERRRHL